MKSFNCPACDFETEVDMMDYSGGDIDFTCFSCGHEWTENPYEDHADTLCDQARDL